MFPVVPPDRGRKAFRWDRLRGMRPEHQAFIESIQPYNRPGGVAPAENFIWHLDQLANIDKHRLLVPIALGMVPGDTLSIHWRASEPDVIRDMHNFPGRTQDGGIIACCEIAQGYVGDVEVQPDFPFHVALAGLPNADFVNTLALLAGSVRAVVNDLRPAFA